MTPRTRAGVAVDAYSQLPECVQAGISREGYAWLSDEEKQSLVSDMTDPDPDSEDPPL